MSAFSHTAPGRRLAHLAAPDAVVSSGVVRPNAGLLVDAPDQLDAR